MKKLEELADSFLNTELISGSHFISPSNPGIRDFCAEWIANRPILLRKFLPTIQLLTQVEWVVDHVTKKLGSVNDEAVLQLCYAALNSAVAPGQSFAEASARGQVAAGTGQIRPQARAWTTIRMRLALEIARRMASPTRVLMELQRQLDTAVHLLDTEPVFPLALSGIAVKARSLGLDCGQYVEAIAKLIAAEAVHLEAWEALAELVEVFDDVFPAALAQNLHYSCLEWVQEELTFDIGFYGDPDEIDDVLAVARTFGVKVPSSVVADARNQLELAGSPDHSKELSDGPDARTVALADEDAMIRNLFTAFIQHRTAPILPFYEAVFGRQVMDD
jgi:hypothetical protein